MITYIEIENCLTLKDWFFCTWKFRCEESNEIEWGFRICGVNITNGKCTC